MYQGNNKLLFGTKIPLVQYLLPNAIANLCSSSSDRTGHSFL